MAFSPGNSSRPVVLTPQDPRRKYDPSAVSGALAQGPKMPSGPQRSTAPAAAPAPASAPRGTGGSGFVGFEQYFGANEPAAQRSAQQQAQAISSGVREQAQQQAGGSKGYAAAAGTARAGAQDAFKDFVSGSSTSATPGQAGSAGAFDAMLAGRANPKAAAEEQKGLGALANYFGQQQQNAAQLENYQAGLQRSAEYRQRQEQAYQDWYTNLPQAYKTNYTEAELRQIYKDDPSPVSGMLKTPGSSL